MTRVRSIHSEPVCATGLFGIADLQEMRGGAPETQEEPRQSDYQGRAYCRNCLGALTFDAEQSRFIACDCELSPVGQMRVPCAGGCGELVGPGQKCVACSIAAVHAWLAARKRKVIE